MKIPDIAKNLVTTIVIFYLIDADVVANIVLEMASVVWPKCFYDILLHTTKKSLSVLSLHLI